MECKKNVDIVFMKKLDDYKYSMHVPGGFMGCELKRTSLHDSDGKHKFPNGCNRFDLIEILKN